MKRPGYYFKSSLGKDHGKPGSVTIVLKEQLLASPSRSMWELIRNVCLGGPYSRTAVLGTLEVGSEIHVIQVHLLIQE